MSGKTRRLDQARTMAATAEPTLKPIDIGMPRPWRISLRLMHLQTELIFDLTSQIVIGRANPDGGFFPDVDLGPFGGGDLGVSREHLFFRLDGERVVVEDNESANGTKLNGEWMKPHQPYPLRHGDELMLGLMKIQVELLINPFF